MVSFGYPVKEVREGLARLIVPDPDAYRRPDGVYEPAWAPVFYNPRMAFNRDIATTFARAYARLRGLSQLTVVEPLAGSGVRAVRYALEAGARVYACDIDEEAVKLAKKNVEINHVEELVVVEKNDANTYMYSLRLQGVRPAIVDVDPFGSPAPFLEAAIDLAGPRGVVAVTATDTAPLAGAYPATLRRRYEVHPARMLWEKEQAVRVLLGYIVRRAASREYGVRVLLAYYADHYVRAYVELEKGARRADKSLEQLGYGTYCPLCGYTSFTREAPAYCPYCGTRTPHVGPIYTGSLVDTQLLELMEQEAKNMEWLAERDRVLKLLAQLREEASIPKPYYRLDKLCSLLRRNMPKLARVVDELRKRGYHAARTHFDPRGLKTDAPHPVLLDILRSL